MTIAKTLLAILVAICLIFVFLWTAGALYYDAGQQTVRGWILLVVWTAVFATTLYYVKPLWRAIIVITSLFACVLFWWLTLKPSHERNWDPNFSQLPQFIVDGDLLTVHNVRNTNYRSLDDYDLRYEARQYRLSELQAVDLLVLYWGSDVMSHPMVIFDFGDDRHLCFSIEVRYQANEEYDTLRSIYRQYELMYVVTDERDAILRRTKFGEKQDCYLYRYQTGAAKNREFLEEFIDQTNSIFKQPRWYNAVTANCTTSIYRQRREKVSWDWRILFSGSMDKMLYEWGRLYQDLPFEELRKASWINDRANLATEENFSKAIREGLPGF